MTDCLFFVGLSFGVEWSGVEVCYTKRYLCCGSIQHLLTYLGNADQKGKVMGIFRSLGALARAIGPVVSCTGKRSNPVGGPV